MFEYLKQVLESDSIHLKKYFKNQFGIYLKQSETLFQEFIRITPYPDRSIELACQVELYNTQKGQELVNKVIDVLIKQFNTPEIRVVLTF